MRLGVALIVLIPDLRRVLSKFRYLTPHRYQVPIGMLGSLAPMDPPLKHINAAGGGS